MKKLRTLAKILSLALVIGLVFSFVACKGALKLEAFTVDRSSVKTVYYIGEEIDFSGIRASVRYSDDSLNTEYTLEDLTITYDKDITATVGTKQIKVSFMDPHLGVEQSVIVQITVKEDPNAVKHTAYYIDASAVKTAYLMGEAIDFTGIKVYEKFSDNSEAEITDLSLLTYEPVLDGLTATAGNKVVKVKYDGEDAGSVTVKVSDPEVLKNDVISVVVGGNYKTTYEVGETVDLTGMTVTVTYEEGEVETLTHEALTAEQIDMSTAGTKTVVISFFDPINNEEDFTSISITVLKKDKVVQFEKPDTLTAFDSDNKYAGSHNYGETGFSAEFAKGGQLYVIGDDNVFKMIPTLVVDDNGLDKDLEKFYADVNIYVWNGTEYVLTNKTANNATNYTYTYEGATVATVNTYDGEYFFASPIEKVKIEVMPSMEYYKNLDSFNAVVLEAKVIDAYNVYSAKELSVIDNSGRQGWIDLKAEAGLAGIAPAGIVLHNDVSLRYTDVPQDFFYKSSDTVQYRNSATGEIKEYANTAGMNYLVDWTVIYQRTSTSDFTMQGNFFTINVSDFPLVASPSIFGADSEKDYGTDYSNATLFMFESTSTSWLAPSDVPVKGAVTIDNLALIGNAGIDGWVVEKVHGDTIDSATELVTAGGLIMLKSSRYAITTLNNVINNSFFIAYFPDYQGYMCVNDSKCYDSYQNAVFAWADSTMAVNDSYIYGTGGPIVIAQSAQPVSSGPHYSPDVVINNTKLETHVTGEEVWFKSVGATATISQIKGLGYGLDQLINGAGKMVNPALNLHANFVGADGKMNATATLMNNASNADQALTDIHVEGNVLTDGTGINRWYEGENMDPTWATIYYAMTTVKPELAGAPILVTYDASGAAQILIYDGNAISGFCDMNGNAIGTDLANQAAIINNFATADEVVLYMGGLAVMFDLYH